MTIWTEMKTAFFPLLLLTAVPALATDIPMDTVVLGGLDKVAGRVSTFKDKADSLRRI